MGKKKQGIVVEIERAIVYYNALHTNKKSGKQFKISMYFLDDMYVIVAKSGGEVSIEAWTDLTTARYNLNAIIRTVERVKSD